MNIPDNLVTMIKTELENLRRYELMSNDAIRMANEAIVNHTDTREKYRKQRSDLLQFCEENGIDLTEKQ